MSNCIKFEIKVCLMMSWGTTPAWKWWQQHQQQAIGAACLAAASASLSAATCPVFVLPAAVSGYPGCGCVWSWFELKVSEGSK
jgi:hypothetical protein